MLEAGLLANGGFAEIAHDLLACPYRLSKRMRPCISTCATSSKPAATSSAAYSCRADDRSKASTGCARRWATSTDGGAIRFVEAGELSPEMQSRLAGWAEAARLAGLRSLVREVETDRKSGLGVIQLFLSELAAEGGTLAGEPEDNKWERLRQTLEQCPPAAGSQPAAAAAKAAVA